MFKNRYEIKNILDMNISDAEKKELIAQLKNIKTNIGRSIMISEEEVQYFLNLENTVIDNLGLSWTDREDDNNEGFTSETLNDVEIVFHANNVKGYKLQYFNEFLIEDEDLLYELLEDEVYENLMDLLGSDNEMYKESEVLVSNDVCFKVIEVNDGREDVGFIEIKLEVL